MNTCNAEHQQLIDDCQARESRLTDWERGFIDSIAGQLGNGRTLSQKQADTLDQIWERVTSTGARLQR